MSGDVGRAASPNRLSSATEPASGLGPSGFDPARVGNASLYLGDCLDILATLEPESVDSCVCDPPYHLTSIVKRFGAANAAPAQVGATGAYARASRGFMGQQWDGGDVAFRPETWEAVYRILKPGAHLVAFSGTRTYHRMVCAIEDAGFEVRDQLAWVYGSGFPKSHDVSKQIDKRGGANIAWFGPWLRKERERRGIGQRELCEMTGFHGAVNRGGAVANWELGLNLPTVEQFNTLCRVLDLPFKNITEAEREVIGVVAGSKLAVAPGQVNDRSAIVMDVTAPATPEAEQWQGWGTALKPAWEPICLARKPLQGTVAANVLEHGAGALNIDGCRIEGEVPKPGNVNPTNASGSNGIYGLDKRLSRQAEWEPSSLGRWPANIIHDGSDEVLAHFPAEAGSNSATPGPKSGDVFGSWGERTPGYAGGRSSAARFFYCAKTSSSERHIGCEDLKDGKNPHPTVKPVDLMRWLTRLVTPKGGLVLDPFAGSGSTLIAAGWEGFRSIGCELSPEYADVALRRLAAAQAEIEDSRRQGSLFDGEAQAA